LQSIGNTKLTLRSLFSEDLEDKPDYVQVQAELTTQERNDERLEQIVSRLSLEPGVVSIRWRIIEAEYG